VKKIITTSQLNEFREELNNKSLILVGGCFDILHPGHVAFLTEAKKLGDTLIVLLESDQAVTKRKGQGRPINNVSSRSRNIIQKTPSDIVIELPFPFTDSDYDNLVTQIKPAIIATTKGDPYKDHKSRQAIKNGSELIEVMDRVGDYSTTNILK